AAPPPHPRINSGTLVARMVANHTCGTTMNLINLPSALLPQTGTASSASALAPELALPEGADPEALFAALLAGQLQALIPLAADGVEQVADDSAEGQGDPAGSVFTDVVTMLQDPQAAPDLTALAAATTPPAPAVQVPAGFKDADDGNDPRQGLAIPSAAIAASDHDASSAQALLPASDLKAGVVMMPALPETKGEAAVSPSQGAMTFTLPHILQSSLNTQPQPPAAMLPQTTIPQPVASQAWGGMVGERVVWMFGQQHQSAEIMLNPPALGPLEVRLSMSDGQASLTFTTQHAPVREALEAATPRLREMLSESGIGLGNVSVNVGNFSRQDPQANFRTPAAWNEPGVNQDFPQLTTGLPDRKGNGLLDLFA
ncbi:MAG: hypothetical protein FGM62_10015, partial [Methylobacterium sp.]|nr:hypothetical protein [Methylobacterium sp.]